MSTPRTAKVMLKQIDNFLAAANRGKKSREEAEMLWNVMAALRGPDTSGVGSKGSTTTHVRRAALPKTAERNWHLPASFTIVNPFSLGDSRGHFMNHIFVAVEALQKMGLWKGGKI